MIFLKGLIQYHQERKKLKEKLNRAEFIKRLKEEQSGNKPWWRPSVNSRISEKIWAIGILISTLLSIGIILWANILSLLFPSMGHASVINLSIALSAFSAFVLKWKFSDKKAGN